MIDIENVVFNKVATALRNEYSDISVYGEYVSSPTSFPCVTLVEDDNYIYRRTQDTNVENHVNVMYTLTVYSNLESGKKQEAKAIMAKADELMLGMNFTRTMRNQIPNEDRTIYRIVARYEAVVEKAATIGDDDVYHIYRE